MYLNGTQLRLRKARRRSNPRRVLFLLALILGGIVVVGLKERGVVQPLGVPTPLPTRVPGSFASEAEAQFAAGNLKEAIAAYQRAAEADPTNLDYWVAMARVQIYAGDYEGALDSAESRALMIDANSAKARAIYAWTLDWNVAQGCRCKTLAEAEAAAVTAIALDPNYAPAHAFYSEILNDAQKWSQGYQEADVALRLDPNLLEAHRAMGYALESQGYYAEAIEHYKAALNINPNLITLYLSIGLNYRVLQDYESAIRYFSKASSIDPENVEPYLYLSRTHYQNDELGTAIQYLEQALEREPANPDIHGRLGLILFKRRNYEGAEPELRLAIVGGPVDGDGNPLTDLAGDPLLDANGEPVKSADGRVLTVQPMPLAGAITLEYYYTYGNLLAYLRKCEPRQAPYYLGLALNFAPDDPTVKGSYDESMAICSGELTPEEAIFGTATPPGPPATPSGATPTPAP